MPVFLRRAHPSARAAPPIVCLIGLVALAGCGGGGERGARMPPPDAQRAVAARFARAVLHGDAAGARPLLLEANEPAMTFLLRRATVHWRNQRVTIRARPRHSGARWLFSYTSMRSFEDGRFEREDGGLVIVLAPSPSGARVRYFTFVDVRARYSTHHDGQLLPSKR